MRPQEILGMVEEAAGTRMFEDRKEKAKKTMGKKDRRVQELTANLVEEITPKLDRLREEKRAFLQFQKSRTELEKINRVLRAWEWAESQKRVEEKKAEIAAKEKEKDGMNKANAKLAKEVAAAEKDVETVKAQREKEMKKGGKFKKLEEDVGEREKALVKIKTQVDIKNGTIADEEGKMIELERDLQEVRDSDSIRCTFH